MDMGHRKWWMFHRWSSEFENGLNKYIETAVASEGEGNEIRCPCVNCCYRSWFDKDVVWDHVIVKGFLPLPEMNLESRVNSESRTNDDIVDRDAGSYLNGDMDGLLHDISREGPNDVAKKFFKLVEEGQQELYPRCKNFSKLSFILRLFVFKHDHKLSNTAFADLLELLKAMQPDAKLPSSFNEARNTLKALGLDYVRIDACPNDCMLFWEEHSGATHFHICKASRWKSDKKDKGKAKCSKISAKVLRYFPVKDRLQRLYMCAKTASHMTWHERSRRKDSFLRHSADGEDWKKFDISFPRFAQDPRNVRLALSTDGFSPFNTMGIVHSTWPVVLINYNLPPWLCMKPEFIMLSLLIPGPLSPGNDIDVYLQPLIKDLNDLWDVGVETFDASSNEMFTMRAALLTTISDFPAYAMLSGWSTKGKTACSCCHYETCSQWLTHSKKHCYMGHRRFLDNNHPYRRQKKQFNGKKEDKSAPSRLTGFEVSELLYNYQNTFGKSEQKKRKSYKKMKEGDSSPWKKKSIFFRLLYWKFIACRHSLDVMHIEKNVCDNIIGTLLNIPGKTKDHLNARKDLVELKMWQELQPRKSADGKHDVLEKSCFWMTKQEKRIFFHVIKDAKLPQGYGSNIARCVQMDDQKISNYKSHDAHFLVQYLLPVAARLTLRKDVVVPLMRLSAFLEGICSKVLSLENLEHLQNEVVQILCQFEKKFPPTFFDVMVHLLVHLVDEIRCDGPVPTRWMYPIERYLRKLKLYMRNKNRPEGSMAEGYLLEKCANFCSRYLDGGSDSSRISSMEALNQPKGLPSIFLRKGRPISGKGKTSKKRKVYGSSQLDLKMLSQAHRYVLFNSSCDEVDAYLRDHETIVSGLRKRKWSSSQIHGRDFTEWFKEKVELQKHNGEHVQEHIEMLASGPSTVVKTYTGYSINGFKFHTLKRDAGCVTSNNGVMVTALTENFASSKDKNPIMSDITYHGSIEKITEIHYRAPCDIILFKCVWYHAEKDDYGLTCVNRNRLVCVEEPFILASQAHQVFFVDDPIRVGWSFVLQNLPKDRDDIRCEPLEEECPEMSWAPDHFDQERSDNIDDVEVTRVRGGVPATVVDGDGNIIYD